MSSVRAARSVRSVRSVRSARPAHWLAGPARLWPWLAAALIGCGAQPTPTPIAPTARPDVTVLQLNDVYEINPVGGGGGLARVATLRAQLEAQGPVLTVLAGDTLSPSAIGLAKVDGERLAGAQMIATFNVMGLDVATFGNHEFDLKEAQLLACLKASRFTWISSNVTRADGSPFPGVPTRLVRQVGAVRVGVFAVTLGSNPKGWVRYDTDFAAVARREIAALQAEGAQIIVALTHLDLADDIALAVQVPEIDLVLGGHEHENWRVDRGADLTPVRKADANARTVFVHRVYARAGQARVDSELVVVDGTIADEPKTAAEAKEWTDKAFAAYRAQGIDPDEVVTTAWTALDGLEASVRNGSTALTALIGESMQVGGAAVTIFNSGSIRIDDVIAQGSPITAYDVLRIMPFGGQVVTGQWTGALLAQVLDAGQANLGKGGWLQTSGVGGVAGAWTVGGRPLDPAATYVVAINDFLLMGLEDNLAFLTREAPGLSALVAGDDLRTLLIARLKAGPGAAAAPTASR